MNKTDCSTGYETIMGYIGTSNIDPSYKQHLEMMKNAGKDFSVYHTEIDVERFHVDVLKQVIGKNGYYFILTTHKCNIDFIWHDHQKKKFLFWGPNPYQVDKAARIIYSRLIKKSNPNTAQF